MGFRAFVTQYWWVFLVLAVAIILLWFYSKQNAYTKRKIGKFFNKTNLLILAIVLGWYVWWKLGAESTVSNAHRWMPMIILLIGLVYQTFEALRNKSPQFVSPNFHGSYAKEPWRVNGFLVYAIDGFKAGGLYVENAKRIVVVREETAELFDEGSVSIANLGFCSKYELDDDVRQFIENNKFLKKAQDKIYYGWFDSLEKVDWDFQKLRDLEKAQNSNNIHALLKKELNVDNPKVSTLYWMYRNLSKAVNKQTEMYDSTVQAIEKGVEHHKRVKDVYVDKEDKGYKVDGHEESY